MCKINFLLLQKINFVLVYKINFLVMRKKFANDFEIMEIKNEITRKINLLGR